MYNTLYIVNSGKRELRNVFNSSNRESQQRKQHTPAKQYLSLPLPCALAGRQACKRVTPPPTHNMSKGGLSSIIFALLFIALRLNGRLIDHFNNHWGISIVKCDYSIFIIWNFLLNSYSPILITKYFRFKSRGNSNHFVPLVVTV